MGSSVDGHMCRGETFKQGFHNTIVSAGPFDCLDYFVGTSTNAQSLLYSAFHQHKENLIFTVPQKRGAVHIDLG